MTSMVNAKYLSEILNLITCLSTNMFKFTDFGLRKRSARLVFIVVKYARAQLTVTVAVAVDKAHSPVRRATLLLARRMCRDRLGEVSYTYISTLH
jgi:hypothetical protein